MRNSANIIFFDTESGGLDVDTLEILSIAGKAFSGITLQEFPKEEGEFYSLMKPLDFNNISQKALDVNKITIAQLRDAPERGLVLQAFSKYCAKFNKGNFGFPIGGGKNILNFDLPILNRVFKFHGIKYPFNQRVSLELEHFLYFYTNQSQEELPNIKLDTLVKFFGFNIKGSTHNAMTDTKITAALIIKFLKLGRHFEKNIKFRDSCKDLVID